MSTTSSVELPTSLSARRRHLSQGSLTILSQVSSTLLLVIGELQGLIRELSWNRNDQESMVSEGVSPLASPFLESIVLTLFLPLSQQEIDRSNPFSRSSYFTSTRAALCSLDQGQVETQEPSSTSTTNETDRTARRSVAVQRKLASDFPHFSSTSHYLFRILRIVIVGLFFEKNRTRGRTLRRRRHQVDRPFCRVHRRT